MSNCFYYVITIALSIFTDCLISIYDVSLSTSSKYAASSLFLMRPRTTVSSANLTIEVEL